MLSRERKEKKRPGKGDNKSTEMGEVIFYYLEIDYISYIDGI